MSQSNPEIARSIVADGIRSNYHDLGSGHPLLMIHGSGPGVSAWANWRLVMPELAKQARVIAPDMVGFGFTERPAGQRYDIGLIHADASIYKVPQLTRPVPEEAGATLDDVLVQIH